MTQLEEIVLQDKMRDLYDHLRYYGFREIERAAVTLSELPETPMVNHWPDLKSVFDTWDLFHSIATTCDFDEFEKALTGTSLNEDTLLNPHQRAIFFDKEQLTIQARFLLDFLISINDFFELEVSLIERGYNIQAA